MAINIFQGSRSKNSPNNASNSLRAKASMSALDAPGQTSDSGGTAVKTQGTLGKVGSFIGKTAGIAAKFLPGIGGVIAKGVSNILNDPEWWQSIPGDPITLNLPLRMSTVESAGIIKSDGTAEAVGAVYPRAAIAEFCSTFDQSPDSVSGTGVEYVLRPTEQMVTQYLMPEIRKVINAIPLQSAAAYAEVLSAQATLYALWRQLRKCDYILKHGMAVMPNLNDPMFPVFRVENAAWLQSTINRLEEYLRASVRLPHTLCEYLAFRFGRVYRSVNCHKAGMIMYNVVGIRSEISKYDFFITRLMNVAASNQEYQSANADLYNTYMDHEQIVVIPDDTQFTYDVKEFMLRTNSDIGYPRQVGETDTYVLNDDAADIIYIDSFLDNPTTFMASTVSTRCKSIDGEVQVLFPIESLNIFLAGISPDVERYTFVLGAATTDIYRSYEDSLWIWTHIDNFKWADFSDACAKVLWDLSLLKALDIYNKNIYAALVPKGGSKLAYDMTAPSMDAGLVQPSVLATEQVYAFANLVNIGRKTSMSYGKAEKLVTKDIANLTESLDIATAKTPAPSSASAAPGKTT